MVLIDESVSFPYGLASSTRLRLLARALVAGGAHPKVLVIQPAVPPLVTELHALGAKGIYENIPYEYLSGTARRPDGFASRRWRKTLGYLRLPWRLLHLRISGALDMLILYTRRLWTIRAISLLAKVLGVPVVLEICEWPVAQVETRGGDAKAARRYCMHACNHVDGAIAISRYIEEHITSRSAPRRSGFSVLRVPALVDAGARTHDHEQVGLNLVLCASLEYHAMVDAALRALALVNQAAQNVSLQLMAGLSAPEQLEWAKARIKVHGVGDDVDLHGYVGDDELTATYGRALALLAPLEDDSQSRSRFPTKIAEYLASGRPVITNPIGDLPEYLQHGRDVWFAKGTDPQSLAEAIQCLCENRTLAQSIGREGRVTALSNFHFAAHSDRLVAFLRDVAQAASSR